MKQSTGWHFESIRELIAGFMHFGTVITFEGHIKSRKSPDMTKTQYTRVDNTIKQKQRVLQRLQDAERGEEEAAIC